MPSATHIIGATNLLMIWRAHGRCRSPLPRRRDEYAAQEITAPPAPPPRRASLVDTFNAFTLLEKRASRDYRAANSHDAAIASHARRLYVPTLLHTTPPILICFRKCIWREPGRQATRCIFPSPRYDTLAYYCYQYRGRALSLPRRALATYISSGDGAGRRM